MLDLNWERIHFTAETDYKAKRCKRVFCTEIRNGKIEYIIRYN